MIQCRLLELMGREGIRFVTRLSEETGINRRTLTLLIENRMLRFDADVLARLCAYFNCQPGDLLTWVPDSERRAGSLGHLPNLGAIESDEQSDRAGAPLA